MYENIQLPSTWAQNKSYNNKPYYLVLLSCNSNEWDEIENHFAGYEIITIERVQNPFQFGRYGLYKLQKNNPSQKYYFMPISQIAHLETALRYNCDYRRLHYKRDMFFSTASKAVSYSSTCNKIIVLEGLENYSNHDSGRYPKYVVTYEPRDP